MNSIHSGLLHPNYCIDEHFVYLPGHKYEHPPIFYGMQSEYNKCTYSMPALSIFPLLLYHYCHTIVAFVMFYPVIQCQTSNTAA